MVRSRPDTAVSTVIHDAAAAAHHTNNRPGTRTPSNNPDGKPRMKLTEEEIAVRVGLPGPVIAELLRPAGATIIAGKRGRAFNDTDVLRAQVAALMLAKGVRWQWVRTAMEHLASHPDALHATLSLWSGIAPSPLHLRHWPFAAATVATALMVLALLVGILLGIHLSPAGLL